MIKTKKFMYSLFALLLLILLTAAPIVSASMLKRSVEDLTKEADNNHRRRNYR